MQVHDSLSWVEALQNDGPVPRAWLGMIMAPPGGFSQQTASTQSSSIYPGVKAEVFSVPLGVREGPGWVLSTVPAHQKLPAFFGFENSTGRGPQACVFSPSLRAPTCLLQLLQRLCPPGGSHVGGTGLPGWERS